MPCRSDYMEQNGREARLQQTAKLYGYALKKLGQDVPKYVKEAANDYYCKDDKSVMALCALIKGMSEKDLNTIVYNGRDKKSRELADWWEEHDKADKAREAKEKKESTDEQLRKSGLAKLTKEEIAALKL